MKIAISSDCNIQIGWNKLHSKAKTSFVTLMYVSCRKYFYVQRTRALFRCTIFFSDTLYNVEKNTPKCGTHFDILTESNDHWGSILNGRTTQKRSIFTALQNDLIHYFIIMKNFRFGPTCNIIQEPHELSSIAVTIKSINEKSRLDQLATTYQSELKYIKH